MHYILTTDPAWEIRATANLIARRYQAFCPSVCTMRPIKRQGTPFKDANGRRVLKRIEGPMFPGYIFIKQRSVIGHFEKVERVAGVGRFLRCGEDFASLPEPLMDAIRREEERQMRAFEESVKQKNTLGIPFVKGARARIEGGPYDDLVGKMVKLSKNGRLKMLFSCFGRETLVDVDAARVKAA